MTGGIGDLLRSRAALSAHDEAAIDGANRYTFDQLNQRANRFAGFLQQAGYGPGDVIAVLCKNGEAITSSLFGAGKLGVITALLNWRLQPEELAYILEDCGATLLVYEAGFADTVDALRKQVTLDRCIQVRRDAADDYTALLDAQSDAEPAADVSPDDVVALMYTSGTTGRPKGVKLTHANLCSAAENCIFTIGWPHRSRFLTVAPMFHIAGLMPVFANTYCGCATVYLPDFHPVAIWDVIEQERITHFMAVPQMLAAMAQAPDIASRDLGALRFVLSGASAVPESLIRHYAELAIPIYQVYGATECSGSATFWTPEMGDECIRSVGRTVLRCHIKVVDPATGESLPAGETGEVWFTGAQVFAGYWNKPEATDQAIVDGYYRTGDLGRLDSEGHLTVVDRLKDMIISGGENVYPAEIEAVLVEHPAIAEVAVIGRADEAWGEVPVAFAVAVPGGELPAQALIDFCRARLAGYKTIKAVWFVDALPRNASSKLLKRELKKQLETSDRLVD